MALPHVFIINMPKRKERKDHMIQLMAELHIKGYEFIEPDTALPSDRITKNEMSLIRTVQKVFDIAKERGLPSFFIFEDDIVIKQTPAWVMDKIQQAQASLPSEWDMLYFEYCYERCEQIKPHNEHLFRVSHPLCTAAIIYNTSSIDKLNECLGVQKLNLDNSYAECLRKGDLNGFLCNPPVFFQDKTFATDIQINLYNDIKGFFYEQKGVTCQSNLIYNLKWLNIMLVMISILIISSVVLFGMVNKRC